MKTDVGQWRTTILRPSPCADRRPLPSPRAARGGAHRAGLEPTRLRPPPKPWLAGFPFSLVYEATDLPPASAGGHKANRSPKRASAWLLEKTSAAARKPCARLARAPSSPPHYRCGRLKPKRRSTLKRASPFLTSSRALRLKPGAFSSDPVNGVPSNGSTQVVAAYEFTHALCLPPSR